MNFESMHWSICSFPLSQIMAADVTEAPPLMPEDIKAFIYGSFASGSFEDGDAVDEAEEIRRNPKTAAEAALEDKTLRRLDNVVIPPDMTRILDSLDCDRQNTAIFVGHDDLIVYDMPCSVDSFYTYSMELIVNPDSMHKKAGRTICFVNGIVTTNPKPASVGVVMDLINDVYAGTRSDNIKGMVKALKLWLLKRKRKKNHSLYDDDNLVTYEELADEVIRDNERNLERFQKNKRIKQFFMHSRIELMSKYYNPDDIATLSREDIQDLSMYFDPTSRGFPDPTDLLFKHRLGHYSQSARGCKPLKELPEEAWIELCTLRGIKITQQIKDAIKMYSALKAKIKDSKDKFVLESDLVRTDTDRKAMRKLLEYEAIAREVDEDGIVRLYTRIMYHTEQIAVSDIERIITNDSLYSVTYMDEGELNPTAMSTDREPCSEQLRAIRYMQKLPIVGISGQGGSGKTDLCAMLFRHIVPDQTLFLTYQNANVANAQSRVTSRAYTIHKLMVLHAQYCQQSPYYEQPKKEDRGKPKKEMGLVFTKCPLENIRFVIIDECGMVNDELFAQVLHALTTCGQLCRLVVCGDHLQQAQTQPGQLFKDLLYGLPGWTLKFQHNHRMSDETAVLFRNNMTAIYNMDLDGFEMNRTTNTLHELPAGLDPALVRRRDRKRHKEITDELEKLLRLAFIEHNIGDQEDLLVIIRTRELRALVTTIIKDQYHDTKDHGFVLNQKITYKRTIHHISPKLCNNEILIIDRIEDVQVDNEKKKDKKLDKAIVSPKSILSQTIKSTSEPRNRERGAFRRLVCHVRGFPMETRIIPWTGNHRRFVIPASAITERSVQGLESDRVCAIKPGAWNKADTNLSMGMVKGRAKNEIIWIAPVEVLKTWITTPEAPRASQLGDKILDMMRPYIAMDKYDAPEDDEDEYIGIKIAQEIIEEKRVEAELAERKRRREAGEPEPEPAVQRPRKMCRAAKLHESSEDEYEDDDEPMQTTQDKKRKRSPSDVPVGSRFSPPQPKTQWTDPLTDDDYHAAFDAYESSMSRDAAPCAMDIE